MLNIFETNLLFTKSFAALPPSPPPLPRPLIPSLTLGTDASSVGVLAPPLYTFKFLKPPLNRPILG